MKSGCHRNLIFPCSSLLAVVLMLLGTPLARALEWDTTAITLKPKPGAQVTVATYNFKNSGDKAVQILGVRTGCGCTDAQVSSSDIPAGERGYIMLVFTIGDRTGRQEKEVLVETSESKDPVKLILKVDLPPAAKPSRS